MTPAEAPIAIGMAAFVTLALIGGAIWLASRPAREEDQQEREAADEFRRNMVHRAGPSGGP